MHGTHSLHTASVTLGAQASRASKSSNSTERAAHRCLLKSEMECRCVSETGGECGWQKPPVQEEWLAGSCGRGGREPAEAHGAAAGFTSRRLVLVASAMAHAGRAI